MPDRGREVRKKSRRHQLSESFRNFSQHLRIPEFGRQSRSPSPTPSTSTRNTPAAQKLPLATPPVTGTPSPAPAPSGISPSTSRPSITTSPLAANPIAASPATANLIATNPTANSPAGTHPAVASLTAAGSIAASPASASPSTATLSAAAQSLPIAATLHQPLSPAEIRQRTVELLKERIRPEEVEKLKWDETTAEQAKEVVNTVTQSMEGKPKHTGKMYKTMQYVNKYCTIIDVAIQHQPQITALVWAGVRTVIQVCELFRWTASVHYPSPPRFA